MITLRNCRYRIMVILAAGALSGAAQDLYNRNLIVNGDAEAGAAASTFNQTPPSVPGWKTYGGFTVQAYGGKDGLTTSDGPKNGGKNYFAGGANTSRSYAEQTIALNGLAPGAKFYLSAFMGKNAGFLDTSLMSLRAAFLDDKGQIIQDESVTGPKLETEYAVAQGLHMRTTSGFLLPGATQIKVTLDFGYPSGTSINSLAADSLSLVFTREALTSANLIVNGDAEASVGEEIPGWNGYLSSLKSVAYVPKLNNYDLSLQSPGPADRGNTFLWIKFGGNRGDERRFWQTVDVARSPYLSVIDAGQMRYKLSGWLGADSGTKDEIKMRISFLDNKTPATTLGTVESPTVIARGLAMDEAVAGGIDATLPPGTRRILVEVIATKRGGAPDDMSGFVDNVALFLTAPPQIVIEGLGNAANYVSGKVSPGEVLVVYGTDFGPGALASYQISNGIFNSETGETRIYFDGVPAPMLYAVSGQLSCIVPYSVAGKPSTQVQVEYRGVRGNIVSIPVAAAVPGLFTLDKTGKNQVAALNQDYSVNGPTAPADKGSVMMLFATGEGQTSPGGVDGKIATDSYPRPLVPVTVQMGDKQAEVLYYGAAPGLVAGVMQVNVKVPADSSSGNVPVVIKVGGDASQSGATITVK